MFGTILIAEDDQSYRQTVARYLRSLQFEVYEACDIAQASEYLKQKPVEVVIMDIGLGKRAALMGEASKRATSGCVGYALLESIRTMSTYVSVIVLTSLDETIYEVSSLNRGADDFVLKNIEMDALGARVQCCLRRMRQLCGVKSLRAGNIPSRKSTYTPDEAPVEIGDFCLDPKQRRLQIAGGAFMDLTTNEVRLLHLMMCAQGKVFGKHEILEALWGTEAKQTYHSVEALVKSVRRKIEPHPGKPKYLLNLYGAGFRLQLGRSGALKKVPAPRD
jgi:DNA-binding response OmpR family regulator